MKIILNSNVKHLLPALLLSLLVSCGGQTAVSVNQSEEGTQKPIEGSEKLTTEQRSLEAFNEIKIEVGDVKVRYCAPSATITFDDNLIGKVITSVNRNILTISFDGKYFSKSYLAIDLCTFDLDKVRAFGAANIDIEMTTSNLNVTAFGHSTVNIRDLQGSISNFDLRGSNAMYVSGTTEQYTLNTKGVSFFQGFELHSGTATVNLEGYSYVEINTQALKGAVTNSTEIIYVNGSPESTADIYVNDDAFTDITMPEGANTINYVTL